MKRYIKPVCVIYYIIMSFLLNSYMLVKASPFTLLIVIPLFLLLNSLAGMKPTGTKKLRLRVCNHGTLLLTIFIFSLIPSVIWHIVLAFLTIPNTYMDLVWSIVYCVVASAILFWNGIICVYCTSTQMGIKWRLIGALCGMIPILNLIVLTRIINVTSDELDFEIEKEIISTSPELAEICKTKYPLVLVHGVFFRDSKLFNYWGRIPKELETNGAKIFYGNHSSAASIADSAAELKERITEILAETGAKKVNIIAHSKGGLDCRYAIAKLDIGDCVASLTTINTPHKGCLFADCLLTKIPADIKDKVANTYNSTLKKLSEENPDFLAAVGDLTDEHCNALDAEMPTPKGVYCQSVGSVLTKAVNGKFPLNFSYHLVKYFSGDNDGLVDEKSFHWGENYTLLKPQAKRGISHGDIIDLNRENISDFDVREFYVNLVADLKNKGL